MSPSAPTCQARAGLEALDVDLDRVWAGVAARYGRGRRDDRAMAGRLLGSPGLARALVTTPSLLLSWLAATAVVLAVGVLVTAQTGVPWVALLAPALAGCRHRLCLRPGHRPGLRVEQSMAVSDRMVLLARALAVFGVNAALGLVASLVSAGAAGLTLGWLVPMTTVAALASRRRRWRARPTWGSRRRWPAGASSCWPARCGRATWQQRSHRATHAAYLAATLACLAVALYATSARKIEG